MLLQHYKTVNNLLYYILLYIVIVGNCAHHQYRDF